MTWRTSEALVESKTASDAEATGGPAAPGSAGLDADES